MYVYEYGYTSVAPGPRQSSTRWVVWALVLAAAAAGALWWRREAARGRELRVTPLDSVVHTEAAGISGTWTPAWAGATAYVSDAVEPRVAVAARRALNQVVARAPRAYVSGITRVSDDAFDITYAPALGRTPMSVRVSPATAAATPAATSPGLPVPATLDTGTFANFSMVSY